MGQELAGFGTAQALLQPGQFLRPKLLTFDANGFGESEPVSFEYPADILAAGLWAQARMPELPVGLVGASFGAGWGLCSTARAGSPFRAAVLEGVFPTLPDFWRHYPFAYAALKASQLVWPPLERNLRPVREAARLVGHPAVLLVYGEDDEFTPPAHGQRVMDALATTADAQLCVLPNVGHTFAYRDAREEYVARVIPFLTDALRVCGGSEPQAAGQTAASDRQRPRPG